MTKIYLIRHAEAEGNIYRRMHGQYDSRITPNGACQRLPCAAGRSASAEPAFF